jgi:outer membrane protein assembly factor BamB
MLLLKEGGITTVFETSAGMPLRGAVRVGAGGSYFASPVVGDGKIYLAGENGTVVVLRNSAKYEEIARNDLGESILATPAIADGRLIIRTRTKLLCIAAESVH